MVQPIINFFKLVQILRERGNWKLIRHSRKQLLDFIMCRKGLHKKSLIKVIPHWLYLLQGLDALVWRLETFGFLFLPEAEETTKRHLLRYLQPF